MIDALRSFVSPLKKYTLMAKTAFITGISGQDGAYLAKLLLEKGYRVVGATRRTASINTLRLQYLGVEKDVELIDFDLLEFTNILRVIEQTAPDEIYNLAAQSFVGTSFEQPLLTGNVNALGVTRILEAIRTFGISSCRFYQASTSELFGKVQTVPQNEETSFHPRSPYGVAKLYSHWITVNYRESFGLHCSSGILFNHESPLRGVDFVTRKITLGLANIQAGNQEFLELGNLDAQRDWGFAGNYVEAMWLMLQQAIPYDYVIATGKTHSIRKLIELAAPLYGIEIEWSGEGVDTVGTDRKTGKAIIKINPKYFRPAEVDLLVGDSSKAKEKLGWISKTSFAELVEVMAAADQKRVGDGQVNF